MILHKKMMWPISLLLLLFATQFLTGCAAMRGVAEGGMAMMEEPSMELVLDRLNTAAAAADIAHTCLNEVAVSDVVTWPKELDTVQKKDVKPILNALAADGAYAAHGGFISPIKAHIALAQNVLYEIPPDLYASAGSCYENGEETIINGVYYKINFIKTKTGTQIKITKKDNPTLDEIKRAIDQYVKNIFKPGTCKNKASILKRKGKLKPQPGSNVYAGIMTALYDILPNGEEIKSAYEEYDAVNQNVMALSDEISSLNKDKRKIKNKKEPEGPFKTIEEIEEELKIKKEELTRLKEELDEKKNILSTELDKISEHRGEITDPQQLKILENIVEACKSIEGLLTDSVTLTSIAIAKLPTSLAGLMDEIQQLANPKPQSSGLFASFGNPATGQAIQMAYLPLRLARLRYNAGNVADNIQTIMTVLKNDIALLATIHSEVSELIDIEVAK
ncbi:hypothetical protein [Desulfovulcanus sp.]